MQTFGASERKRKDAVFPLNGLPPSLPCSPVSLPSRARGRKPLADLSAGQLGVWGVVASEATGELSI